MLNRIVAALVLVLAFAATVLADATADGRAVSDAFAKACSAGDVAGVMALYEDNATAIWPGEDEVATGKPAIEKLVKGACKPGSGSSVNTLVSQDSKAIGKDYIFIVGNWDATSLGPDGYPVKVQIRTTELLHKSGGKWRYEVDHASATGVMEYSLKAVPHPTRHPSIK